MRLDTEFVKLPFQYDVERLQYEVNLFDESQWIPHPLGFEGNLSIPLISLNGEYNDAMCGPMQPTDALRQSPYLQQVIASLGCVCGRSRLMRLEPGSEVPRHSDLNYHWHKHIRIHIPVLTHPKVDFWCSDKMVNMAAGECWIFDTFKSHIVENKSDQTRVHLVVDSYGSPQFWDLVEKSEKPFAKDPMCKLSPQMIAYESGKSVTIPTEQFNAPLVLNPGEIEGLALNLIVDARQNKDNSDDEIRSCETILKKFSYRWREIWSLYGTTTAGWPHYRQALESLKITLQPIKGKINLASNGGDIMFPLFGHIINNAVNSHVFHDYNRLQQQMNQNVPQQPVAMTPQPMQPQKEPQQAPPQKLHRNDICYCGSGKRYKHCHGQ